MIAALAALLIIFGVGRKDVRQVTGHQNGGQADFLVVLNEYDVVEATAAADLDALLEMLAEMGVLEK